MAVPDEDTRRFIGRIEAAIATAQQWDADPALLAECRALIPLQKVEQDYKRDDDILYRGNALFLKHLTLYFKENVMTWVNQPPCSKCGNEENMESRTTRGAETQEEREGGATRVETYFCPKCDDTTTTFPRYNSVKKLLETRKGRCGEYANLFGLYCRAVGFETRYCSDFTDHVWVECLVDGEWIMADACEGLIDKSSMYEDGWGKDLNYIIGATTDSVVDVTPRYTRKWFQSEFQARRRAICSSEEQSQHVIKQCNATLQKSCSKNRCEELNRRLEREQRMLGSYQQSTAWTDAEKHGEGRISGSLQWKLLRKEAGTVNGETKEEEKVPFVQSWHVEAFYPRCEDGVTISLSPTGIVVSGAECSVIGSSISVVVIDEEFFGCILQSRGFDSWSNVSDFVETLPTHRIVAIQGGEKDSTSDGGSVKRGLARLGGFTTPENGECLLYLGQVDANPSWTKLEHVSENEESGFQVCFAATKPKPSPKLRTERDTVPRRIACRLPESVMPLQTQLLASEEQKRVAFQRFSEQRDGHAKKYIGYTTKANSPIYLIDSTAYPFSHSDCGWNTFHFLPQPLVPEDDVGIVEANTKAGAPKVDVPLETFFFTTLFGPNLVVNGTPGSPPDLVDTTVALHNNRLVALYFSAHWCGPCRQFTPMLAEAYTHLKEEYPSHGLEIVFVSSDRDSASFQQYFASMPWLAVPFEMGAIPQIKARFGVRGIPALIVLDAMSGNIVVPASDSRREVMQACQRGDDGIEDMLESWIARTPQESQEILAMLELSCADDNDGDAKDKNGNDKEHPYLVKSVDTPASPAKDTAAMVKEAFAKLVAQGVEPNVAAAKAIQLVAEQQKSGGTSSSLEPGPLNEIEWKLVETTSASSPKDFTSIVTNLNEFNKDATEQVISTALKYLQNARKEPWTPKFRSFKLSNKIVDRITRFEGALDLLYSLGLYMYPTESDFMLCIPLSADLDVMEGEWKKLLPATESSSKED